MADAFFTRYGIDFVWDANKDQANIEKHGISFKTATQVFEDEFRIEFLDELHSSTEIRYITIGLVHDVLTVVYCEQEDEETGQDELRIISARHATKIEVDAYNNNLLGR